MMAAAQMRIKVDNPRPLDFANAATQWSEWLRRFQRFRNVSGLAQQAVDIQVDTLLYIMGPESEDIYEQFDLDLEDENGDAIERTYQHVIDAFSTYFQPCTNILNYRMQFYNRKQAVDEGAEEYIRSIHSLAVKCHFNDGLTQEDMIKDRLLSGMSDATLSSELQLNENVSLIAVTTKMRAKETIENQMKAEAKVAVVKAKQITSFTSNTKSKMTGRDCKYCIRTHPPRSCPAYGKVCKICSKTNHFAAVCQSRNKTAHSIDANVTSNSVDNDDTSTEYFIKSDNLNVDTVDSNSNVVYVDGFCLEPEVNCVGSQNTSSEWLINMTVGSKVLIAKVDTGAQANVISDSELKRVSPHSIIRPSLIKLTAYSGHTLPILGVAEVEIEYNQLKRKVSFHVLGEEMKARTLIGLPSIKQLGLLDGMGSISHVSSKQSGDDTGKCPIVEEFKDVFTGLGKLETEYKIVIKPDAKPTMCAPRSVPYALRDRLKAELESLCSNGIIEETKEPSEWLNPIVTVVKPNGSLRICLDPQNLNAATVRDRYSFPKVSDIYARLSGSKVFSTLDAKSGFHQIPIDHESSKLTTFLTPFGKFRFLRLPFGITSAAEFFHKTMVDMIGDIPGVEVYIDDVLISAPDAETHEVRLRQVLTKFRDAGLKLNMDKCKFRQSTVTFLGHTVSSQGIKPSVAKVKAIQDAKAPTNKAEVRSLLGVVTYLAKFCPRLSEVTKPLRDLVKKDVDFCWEKAQVDSFENVKKLVANAPVLALFDPNKETIVNVDASSHSLGAVLMQQGKPIEFAAQSLTPTQCLYAQVEKEMLAIQFGLTHFHQYVYGKEIVVESDHQPLVRITQKPLGDLSPRLQRMRLRTLHYQYKVIHVPGKEMYLSDYLSRSCKEGTYEQDLSMQDPMIQVSAVVIRDIEVKNEFIEATVQDSALQILASYTKKGWPKQKRLCNSLANSYWQFRDDITEHESLLYYRERLIVPYIKQSCVIEQLHESHLGITKTQQRARVAVFWPGMNRQIEDRVSSCETCKRHDTKQSHAPLQCSEIPDFPWQTVGSDIFQIKDSHYLVNIDYYSKWVNVVELRDLSSKSVIYELRKQFADFGTVQTLRSDNGPQYASREFKDFVKELSIKHATSSPGYPRSNGLVERAVQTVKNLMTRAIEEGKCFWHSLKMFRNTPLAGDLPSPAQLLQGRNLFDGIPTHQHCLFPRAYDRKDVRNKFLVRQDKMKVYHDKKVSTERTVLKPGDRVRFQSLKGIWEPAVIVEHHDSSRSYMIKNLATGIVIRRNREQLRIDQTYNRMADNHLQVRMQQNKQVIPLVQQGPTSINKASTSVLRTVNPTIPPGLDVSPGRTDSQATVSSPMYHQNVPAPTLRQNSPAVEQSVVQTRSGRVVRKPLRFRE